MTHKNKNHKLHGFLPARHTLHTHLGKETHLNSTKLRLNVILFRFQRAE